MSNVLITTICKAVTGSGDIACSVHTVVVPYTDDGDARLAVKAITDYQNVRYTNGEKMLTQSAIILP